ARRWSYRSVVAMRARPASRRPALQTCLFLLGPGRGHVVHTPQQLHLAPHRVGEMEVQVRVAGIVPQRNARLGDRPIDDGQILPHDAHGRGIEPLLVLRQGGLQLGDGDVGGASPTGDPRVWRGCHGDKLGRIRRSLLQGEPGTATRKEDQSNARRKELWDGEGNSPGRTAAGRVSAYLSFYLRPEIRLGLTIRESLRARDHLAQLAECRVAVPARREMCLEARALGRVELAVEIL